MSRRGIVTASARLLVGRRIVGFVARAERDQDGRTNHDPTIYLDNGARLEFTAEEIFNGSGYGVFPMYVAKKRKGGGKG
jgi:hypothetical protein